MGTIETINKSRLRELIKFLRRYKGLSIESRREFLSKLTTKHIGFISEIVQNFLDKNILIGYSLVEKLKKFKNILYILTSKKTNAVVSKKKILNSMKGLYILELLHDAAIFSINNIIKQ